jgi:hypothetical protein
VWFSDDMETKCIDGLLLMNPSSSGVYEKASNSSLLTDLSKVTITHYQMVISVKQAFRSSSSHTGVVIMSYLLTEQPTV